MYVIEKKERVISESLSKILYLMLHAISLFDRGSVEVDGQMYYIEPVDGKKV